MAIKGQPPLLRADRPYMQQQGEVPGFIGGILEVERVQHVPFRWEHLQRRHQGLVFGQLAQTGARLVIGQDGLPRVGAVLALGTTRGFTQQPPHINAQGSGQLDSRIHGGQAVAALYLGDVRLTDTEALRQRILGEPSIDAGSL
jgi:hypothetical protein